MAFALVILKTLVEIAAYALLGQLVVAAFAWQHRAQNPVYQLLQFVTSPVTRLVRIVTPRQVLDQHIPIAAFLLLVLVWLVSIVGIASACAADMQQAACARLAQGR